MGSLWCNRLIVMCCVFALPLFRAFDAEMQDAFEMWVHTLQAHQRNTDVEWRNTIVSEMQKGEAQKRTAALHAIAMQGLIIRCCAWVLLLERRRWPATGRRGEPAKVVRGCDGPQ
jgi:hypothetical protein